MGEEGILRFREGSASDKAYADKDSGETGKPRATSTLATAIDSDEIQLSDAFNNLLLGNNVLEEQEINAFENQVYERINKTLSDKTPLEKLPRLPGTTAALLERLNDPDSFVEDIIGLIHSEPELAGDVLRLANSAYFHRGERKLFNLQEAVVNIGLEDLRTIILDILLKPVIEIRPIYFKLFGKAIWEHSQQCGRLCGELAKVYQVNKFTAYMLGLIHDIGKIAIFKLLVETYCTADPNSSPRPKVFSRIITEKAGALSLLVVQNWELPRVYLDALREQVGARDNSSLSPLARTLYEGNLITEADSLVKRGLVTPDEAKVLLAKAGLYTDQFESIYKDCSISGNSVPK